jgi:hypothetical protein
VVLSRWPGGLAAVAVTLVACVLVTLDLTDAGLRRWWNGHTLTTDTVAGLLVLLITALVVDQVVLLRPGQTRLCHYPQRVTRLPGVCQRLGRIVRLAPAAESRQQHGQRRPAGNEECG